jgi:hypothetical protein
MRRSPLNGPGFHTFDWVGPFQRDADIDRLDFPDPYPNPEETLLAMEAVVCRGFWAFGTPREEESTSKADRNARRKYRRASGEPPKA